MYGYPHAPHCNSLLTLSLCVTFLGACTLNPTEPVLSAAQPLWISAGIGAKDISSRLANIHAQTNACDARIRGSQRSISFIEASWVVDGDGSAAMVVIENSPLKNPSIEGCVLGLIRQAQFIEPKGVPFAYLKYRISLDARDIETPPEALGTLDPHSVMATLNQNKMRLDACYAQRENKTRELRGKAMLGVRVNPDGKVAWASLNSSTLNDLSVERCLVANLWSIEFEPLQGEAVHWVIPYVLGEPEP